MKNVKVKMNPVRKPCKKYVKRAAGGCEEQPIESMFENMSERLLKIQRDLLMPAMILEREGIQNTITMFGSARIKSPEVAKINFEKIKSSKNKASVAEARRDLEMSKYYGQAEELARRLQEWNNCLKLPEKEQFHIMTGGGPGIMEAANKGAFKAGGRTVGLTIHIPDEQSMNGYVSENLGIDFNYFLMRKFWLLFFAKALIVFPGGTGTFDEFFEVFTLMKTRKTHQQYIPTVLFGKKFWESAVDFDFLIRSDVITKEDLKFFIYADTVDDAFKFITEQLSIHLKK